MKKLMFIFLMLLAAPILRAEIDVSDGRKTVTSAGTREALVATSTMYTKVDICAIEGNTTEVVVGGSAVIASESTRRGIPLYTSGTIPDCYTQETKLGTIGDLKNIYLDVKTSGDGVTYTYFNERK